MPQSQKINRNITKRLIPLYVAVFFQSFVLWYPIEKPFMWHIGFNNASIGLMVAFYSVIMLIAETPSGVLADRWSRKGVLMLASVCLSLSALVGGLSNSPPVYLISSAFWGIFFACYSGLYDTIIYDLLAEETKDNNDEGLFERLYGRILAVDSLGLVLAGLAGGAIANWLGLRQAYYWTVPIAIIPILALIRFHEPSLHKLRVAASIKEQLLTTVRAVMRNRSLLPIVIALIVRATLLYVLFEFSQLWLLALDTPTKYYGIANAVLLASIAAGAVSANRLALSRFNRMSVLLAVMVIGFAVLITSRGLAVLVSAQFIVATCLEAIAVILSRMLHDRLDASVRAGASSATNTAGRFVIIPLALIFGYISNRFSVFAAAYILLGLGLILTGFMMSIAAGNSRRGLEARSHAGLVGLEPK